MRYDLYLTSTFSHQWNRDFNPLIGKALEDKSISCYLPHRDTDQKASPGHIFIQDIDGMRASKVILAIAENETPNWGAEVGFAYAQKTPVVALLQNDHKIPLICRGMVSEFMYVPDLLKIESYIGDLVDLIRKNVRA